MKVYRDRSGRTPSSDGLFSRVKRYFSGPQPQPPPPQTTTLGPPKKRNITSISVPSHSNTLLADLSKSILVSGGTRTVPDSEDSNRILSEFFHEKGGKPLSDIEYEGVMSLLDRSKASITLPLPDLNASKPETDPKATTKENGDANVSRRALNASVLHNNTFAPYSQTKLRNTSMYLNNSSFTASEYKPVYHTFNESTSSRANMSMKRVYHFSGLPSPYQTRIKTPNFTARKLRRITPLGNETEVSTVPSANTTVAESSAASCFRPKSKTANALLSILDNDSKASVETPDEQSVNKETEKGKPLHNPYFRPKRRPVLRPAAPVLTANDISKTVLHSKAERHETPAEENGLKLFKNVEMSDANDAEKMDVVVEEKQQSEPKRDCTEQKHTSTFSFETKLPVESQKKSSTSVAKFSFPPKDLENTKSAFTFSKAGEDSATTKTVGTESSNNLEESSKESSVKGFGFTLPSLKPKDSSSSQSGPLFGFSQSQNIGDVHSSGTAQFSLSSSGSGTVFEPPKEGKTSVLFGSNGPLFGASKPKLDTTGSDASEETKELLFKSSSNGGSIGKQNDVEANKQVTDLRFGAPFALAKPAEEARAPFSFGAAPVSAPSFSFGQTNNKIFAPETEERSEEKSTGLFLGTKSAGDKSKDSKPFSFGNGHAPALANGAVAPQEFEFPEVVPRTVDLNSERVKQYESLFEFC